MDNIYIFGVVDDIFIIYLFYFCQHILISKFAFTQKHSIKYYFKYENRNHNRKIFFRACPKSLSELDFFYYDYFIFIGY